MQKVFYVILIVGCTISLVNVFNKEEKSLEVTNEPKAKNEVVLNDVSPELPKASVKEKKEETKEVKNVKKEVKDEVNVQTITEVKQSNPEADIVYDGLTLDGLSSKLNKLLKSTLANKGSLYASYSLQKGVDPYVAVAITLHETGCAYSCSKIVRECNNVGGMKGSPGCNGSSYKKFDSIDDGIKSFIDNLADNYYKKGLNTVEKINTKYATSNTWSTKINNYIEKIRAS